MTQEKFDTLAERRLPLTVVGIGEKAPPGSALYSTGSASVGMRVESNGICTVAGLENAVPCGVSPNIAPALSTPVEGRSGAPEFSRGISISTFADNAPAGTVTLAP